MKYGHNFQPGGRRSQQTMQMRLLQCAWERPEPHPTCMVESEASWETRETRGRMELLAMTLHSHPDICCLSAAETRGGGVVAINWAKLYGEAPREEDNSTPQHNNSTGAAQGTRPGKRPSLSWLLSFVFRRLLHSVPLYT